MSDPIETGLALLDAQRPTLIQLMLYSMPPGTSEHEAGRAVMREITNFQMIAQGKPELLLCDPASIVLAVKQCICDNLTLAPSSNLVYLVPGSKKISANPEKWISVLTYEPTHNGYLSIARQSGRILDHKRPVVKFDADGKVDTVTVEFLVPSTPEPRWEAITFGKNHFEKWRMASHVKNSRNKTGVDNKTMNWANPNYTSWKGSIDFEFAGSKAIKHAIKKLGNNMNERPFMAAPAHHEPNVAPKNTAATATGEAPFKAPVDSPLPNSLTNLDNKQETEDATHEDVTGTGAAPTEGQKIDVNPADL